MIIDPPPVIAPLQPGVTDTVPPTTKGLAGSGWSGGVGRVALLIGLGSAAGLLLLWGLNDAFVIHGSANAVFSLLAASSAGFALLLLMARGAPRGTATAAPPASTAPGLPATKAFTPAPAPATARVIPMTTAAAMPALVKPRPATALRVESRTLPVAPVAPVAPAHTYSHVLPADRAALLGTPLGAVLLDALVAQPQLAGALLTHALARGQDAPATTPARD